MWEAVRLMALERLAANLTLFLSIPLRGLQAAGRNLSTSAWERKSESRCDIYSPSSSRVSSCSPPRLFATLFIERGYVLRTPGLEGQVVKKRSVCSRAAWASRLTN